MQEGVTPNYSAMVSQELVMLMAHRRALRVETGGDPLVDTCERPEENQAFAQSAVSGCLQTPSADHDQTDLSHADGPSADLPDWPVVRLRRDGARPVCVKALCLLHREDCVEINLNGSTYPVQRRIAFYLTRAQDLILHLAYLPPEDCPARPAYRVWPVSSLYHLTELLQMHGAEICFEVSALPASRVGGEFTLPLAPVLADPAPYHLI